MRTAAKLLGVTLLGTAVRLPGLVSRPMWLDEALQGQISGASGLREVVARSAAMDLHPPGFSLAVHAVVQLLGDAEWVLRLPSLAAGIAAAPLAWAAGRAWGDARTGWVFALAAATCPPWVFYAREARPYAGAILWVLGLLWAAGVHRRAPSGASALGLVGCAVGAVCWQYTGAVVAAAILGVLAMHRRDGPVLGALVALVATSAVLGWTHLAPQLAHRSIAGHLAEAYLAPYSGEIVGFLTHPLAFLGYLAVGQTPYTAVVGLALVPLLAWRGAASRDLVLMAGLPALAVLILSTIGVHPFGGIRQCLVLTPPVLLLVARIASHRARWDLLAAAAVAGALTVQLVRSPGVPVWDLPALVHAWEGVRDPADPVWIAPELGPPAARYGPPGTVGRWTDGSPSLAGPRLWVFSVGDGVPIAGGQPVRRLAAEGVTATLWTR